MFVVQIYIQLQILGLTKHAWILGHLKKKGFNLEKHTSRAEWKDQPADRRMGLGIYVYA